MTTPQRLTILGATGSIGTTAFGLIDHAPERFALEAITAQERVDALVALAKRYHPRFVAIGNEAHYDTLRTALSGMNIEVAAGEAAMVEAAQRPADTVLSAIMGAAGLEPTLAAARRGARIALANKECLVCAGELMLGEVQKHGATLLPVDSEHNAIFQVFDAAAPNTVESITLTASGGPFRNFSNAQMKDVTVEQALNHPNWDMGAKITIDSATMMNKGLEMIEAYYLFPVKAEQINVLVHPESIIHSMVHYHDGSVLAQLGTPDMAIPIAYALSWPVRMPTPAQRLDLAEIATLNFEKPDFSRFPALNLAREALQSGGSAPIILNAANEVAVGAFLNGRIGFLDIAAAVAQSLAQLEHQHIASLEEVHAIDAQARRTTEEHIARHG
ncbi:MAG: 1-deoxy-D-xylulose-5-phosphate reductoisomerase [Rickettsiales bacterium]